IYAASFCSYSHRHHRALHSFPTRRSSDLTHTFRCPVTTRTLTIILTGNNNQRLFTVHVDLNRFPHPHYFTFRFHTRFRTLLDRRSEEHTSELQSRENLVCRLLLEKKKTKR